MCLFAILTFLVASAIAISIPGHQDFKRQANNTGPCGHIRQQSLLNENTCHDMDWYQGADYWPYDITANCTCVFYLDKKVCDPANAIITIGPESGRIMVGTYIEHYSCHWIPAE